MHAAVSRAPSVDARPRLLHGRVRCLHALPRSNPRGGRVGGLGQSAMLFCFPPCRSDTLLMGDLESCKLSEVPWSGSGQVRQPTPTVRCIAAMGFALHCAISMGAAGRGVARSGSL